jgi:hypothetical protein
MAAAVPTARRAAVLFDLDRVVGELTEHRCVCCLAFEKMLRSDSSMQTRTPQQAGVDYDRAH